MEAQKVRKLSILTLKQRIAVIERSERGLSQRALAKEFQCSKSQIQATLSNKDRYLREWLQNGNENSKRRRWQKHEPINNAVLHWLNRARVSGLSISGRILREIASHFASELNIEGFRASNGWLHRFRTRHNIVFRPQRRKEDGGDEGEEEQEDGSSGADPLPLNEALDSIAKHKALANVLRNETLIRILNHAEREYEREIEASRIKETLDRDSVDCDKVLKASPLAFGAGSYNGNPPATATDCETVI